MTTRNLPTAPSRSAFQAILLSTADTPSGQVPSVSVNPNAERTIRQAAQQLPVTPVVATTGGTVTVIYLGSVSWPQLPPSTLLDRLKLKAKQAATRAKQYRELHGDPIDNLASLASFFQGDAERWHEIIDEPYG